MRTLVVFGVTEAAFMVSVSTTFGAIATRSGVEGACERVAGENHRPINNNSEAATLADAHTHRRFAVGRAA